MKGLALTIALLTAAPAYASSNGAISNGQQDQQTIENPQRQQQMDLQQILARGQELQQQLDATRLQQLNALPARPGGGARR